MKNDNTVSIQPCATLPFVEMRQASASSACYHPHSHDEFSFGVIDQGTASYQNLNQQLRTGPCDTVTINPGDLHACNPDSQHWSYRMLFLDTDWVGQLQLEFQDSTGSKLTGNPGSDYHPFATPLVRQQQHYQRFDQLFVMLRQSRVPLETESAMIDYLQYAFLTQEQVSSQDRCVSASSTAVPRSILRTKDRLLDQLDHNHSLAELACEAGMSRYHLIRRFKQYFGLSPHALLLDERIKTAKHLLRRGQALANIASQLGFTDQSHFQRSFKKRVALTPKQYQSFFTSH